MTSMQADSGVHAPVVLLGTFNMSQRTFEQDLSDWLATHPSLSTVQPPLLPPSPLPTDLSDSPLGRETATAAAAAAPPPPQPAFPPLIPDMVAIALQEFAPYPDAFLHGTYNLAAKIQHTANLIRKTLLKTCPGYQFSLLSQVSQVGMTLFVFSRDESMTPYIQSIANASVGTGPWGMGNKGAVATKVAVSLPYPNSRPFEVCFINAHLSAHLNETRRRNDDYLAICRRMIFVEEKDRSRNDVHVNSDSANSYAGLHTMNDDDHHSNSGGSGSSGIGGIGGVGGGVDEDDVDDDSDDAEDFYHMDQDQQPLLNGRGRSSGGGGIGGHGRGTTTTTTPSSERVRKRINRPKGPRKFGSSKKPSVEKTIFSCDYIFWTGDLNYRLDLEESDGTLQKKNGGTMTMFNNKMMKKKSSREDLLSQPTPSPMSASEFVHAIESGHYRALYAHDQLSAQRKTMNVFKGFHEAPLAFAPTYKFRMGTSKYDIRKRIPAWTDRVLWFVHPHDASSVERATEDEVDAWDEHSTGLGYGKLPMESTIRRSRSLYASSDFGMPGPPGVGAGATVGSIATAASILEGPLNKSLATHRSDSMSIRSNSSSISSSNVGGGDGGDARAGTSGSESRSRGTFSSLAKRGSARVPVLDQQMFQPPRASTTLVHSPSTMSLASQSSNGTTMAHLHSSGGGGEPSMTTMASSASLLSNRSGRNSGGAATTATTNSSISPGAGGAAAAAAAAGGAGAGIGPSSTFLTSSSSSSSLLQAQQVAQRVETSTSPLLIHYYTSHPFYVSSDHKPVSALFTLLPHNLATQLQVSPYGIDRHWRLKKFMGQKLTTIAGHLLRWGFLVMGFIALVGLFVFVRRHLHGW